ncbi:MAG: YidC/Oxa1 family membrane protein insertase [Oscillospiraceae bacterium]|jgi:YidC/Oxa1 family membrane protein insertase|nr:YidC/Oxa1 family membrane protein insertase [Oscillospiraceae bacterium]
MYEKLYDILGFLFGPVMYAIFSIVGNYGVAIILFTLFCRLLMLPTAVSQQKNMAKNQRMQFKMRKIQERYKDDKRRLQEETQAFYKREGYNPMSAGCSASMMLQFPIIFGLIAAIYRPLQYTVRLGDQARAVIHALVDTLGAEAGSKSSRYGTMWQLRAVSHFSDFKALMSPDGNMQLSDKMLDTLSSQDFDALKQLVASGDLTFTEKTTQAIADAAAELSGYTPTVGATPLKLLGEQLVALGKDGFAALTAEASYAAGDIMGKIEDFTHHFNLGALDLGVIPQEHGGWYILIPILAGLASMASSLFTYIRSRKQNPTQAKNPMMGCMTFGMPLFSVFLAFQFPAGVAIYWIVSSLIAFLQLVVLSQTHKPAKMLAKLMVEETIQRRSRENSRRRINERQ